MGCYPLETCSFLKGIRWRGEVGGGLEIKGGENAVDMYFIRKEYILKNKNYKIYR